MPTITITFHEDGEEAVQFVIPAEAAAAIQAHVDSLTTREMRVVNNEIVAHEENPFEGSKAKFFLHICNEQILKPILLRRAQAIPQIAQLRAHQEQIERQIQEAIEQAALIRVEGQ
ncbi:MAG: hypothetical protein M9913_17130 [Bryobacteraceae bacterium]|nr:hypothetical protein [Solibacteraceae bacterium]MCO5352591.1 hypothetical protein [Bryobacteraceae bacterium]